MSYVEHPAAYEAATKRNIISNANKTFYKTYPDAGDIVQFLINNSEKNTFYSNLLGYCRLLGIRLVVRLFLPL
jgi:hypothetical protein